jgi:hypothetical protein
MNAKPSAPALLVIDVQRAFDIWDAAGKRRNQPDAIDRIADLLDAFRTKGAPIFHIRHSSNEQDSAFAPDGPGFAAQPQAEAQAGEPVIMKRVNPMSEPIALRERRIGAAEPLGPSGDLGAVDLVEKHVWCADRRSGRQPPESLDDVAGRPGANIDSGFRLWGERFDNLLRCERDERMG